MDIKREDIKEIQEFKKKYCFNFKEYYHNNEEFRKRHLTKALTKVQCECGRMIDRCHLARHKKTPIHEGQLNAIQGKTSEYAKLEAEINGLKKL